MSWAVYIGVTIVLFGFAAFMTGQALAATWRKPGWVVFYMLLLAFADRFIVWSLFSGELLSPSGYAIDAATLTVIGLAAYRMTVARKMVQQYPWLYRRQGVFGWRRLGEE